MRFVDEAKIRVKAGDGGPGIVAWRREKFVPLGGPAGGNGGRGGDVIFIAKEGMSSLLDLKQQSLLQASNGSKGLSKNKTGRHGEDKVVYVPVGTVIKDEEALGEPQELLEHDQQLLICRGGDGGFGNTHFKTRLISAPHKCTEGFKGQERLLSLTLKLMADVGLLGFPNAGKSTLLSHFSNARPKVADYPFTTLKPMVGVCELDFGRTMVIADIPGLIEGACEGHGLGFRFLRHLERVRVLCHLIDVSLKESLIERYDTINRELKTYSDELMALPQIVAINKMDALDPDSTEQLHEFEAMLKERGVEYYRISAVSGSGLTELRNALYRRAKNITVLTQKQPEHDNKIFDPTLKLY